MEIDSNEILYLTRIILLWSVTSMWA